MATRTRRSSLRPPPSSPSLAALLEAEPPSPILSPSDLSSSCTSGEIPILLFDSSLATAASPDNQDDSLFSTPTSHPRTCEFSSKPSLRVTGFESDVFSSLSAGIYLERVLQTDLASDIFGRHALKSEKERRLSLCWSSSLFTGDFIRDGFGVPEQSPDMTGYDLRVGPYNDSWLGARNSNESSKPSSTDSVSHESSREQCSSLQPEHEYALHSGIGEIPYIEDSRSVGAPLEDCNLIMYSLSPASITNLKYHKRGHSVPATRDYPISEIGSREATLIDSCVRETYNAQGSLAHLGPISSLSRRPATHATGPSPTLWRGFQAHTQRNPSLSGSRFQIIPGDQDARRISANSTNDSSPETYVSSQGEKFTSSLPSNVPHHLGFPLLRSPQSSSATNTVKLQSLAPCNYPWLRNVTLCLVIDQEGFRSIEPMFEKVGIRRVHPEFGNKELDVVMFVPATKQGYRFHYAPFEGLPILRRLVVNGDESHDFLSRQACLGLKSNGVYVVHGTEAVSPATVSSASSTSMDNALGMAHAGGRTQEQSKLYWWFEYSIEDHKADQSGRSLDGERVLIPLMFSCSPELLHPRQGKKIKLIHIVRKSVTPKLVAERKRQSYHDLETRINTRHALRAPYPSKTGVESRSTQLAFTQGEAWNLHRRSHSNLREHRLPGVRAKISQNNIFKDDPSDSTEIDLNAGSTHRRRASSAEAHTGPRYIIPPSRLRQLLEEGDCDSPAGGSFNKPKSTSSPPSDFLPLKPSPRFGVYQ